MAVTVNSQAPQDAIAEGAKRLQYATQYFWQQLTRRLSVSNPAPYLDSSKPGEYPRKRTGRGIASVIWGPMDVAGIFANGMKTRAGVLPIGTTNYMLILEFNRDRLGFLKTVEDIKPQLTAILQTKAP